MLIAYIAALLGIFRFRSRDYWKWLAILFTWMLAANMLFYAGGTLEDPTRDGIVTRQIRLAINDGPGMGVFAIAFIVTYWGGAIWMLRKMYLVGKEAEVERHQQEAETGEGISAGRKVAEAVAATIAAIAYVYLAFVMPQMDQLTISPATETQSAADPVAKELRQAAEEVNRSPPQKIDDVTMLMGATASGRVFTYQYAVSRHFSEDQLRQFVLKNVIRSACKDPNMQKAMRDYDVTYRYSYNIPKATLPIVVDATFSECQK